MSLDSFEPQSESLKTAVARGVSAANYEHVLGGIVGRNERWNGSLAQAVLFVHEGVQRTDVVGNPIVDTKQPPRVIFVTATSAIPYAIAVRECWKTAYPHESPPKFFFVDVSYNRLGHNEDGKFILKREEIEQIDLVKVEKLKMIGTKYNAFDNAVVFDEFKFHGYTLMRVGKQLSKAGFTNANFLHGQWGFRNMSTGAIVIGDKPVIRKGNERSPHRPLAIQVNAGSRKLIDDMKMLGRQMGEEILLKNPVEEAEKVERIPKGKNEFALWLISPKQKRFEEAIPFFEDIVRVQNLVEDRRAEGHAHNNLAICYNETGNFEKAIEEADKALDLYQDSNLDYFFLARFRKSIALRGLGKERVKKNYFDQALAIYELHKALRLNDSALLEQEKTKLIANEDKNISSMQQEMQALGLH